MAGITLAQAEEQLAAYIAASLAIARGQSYTIITAAGPRSHTRADLKAVQAQITFWDQQVKRLSRGGMHVVAATPVDD